MNTAVTVPHIQRELELLGQTVVVIGGSSGIGFESARRASAEGAKLILTGRDAERLQRAASEVHVLRTTAFDATDPTLLGQFFRELPTSIDHIMVTVGGPHYGRLIDLDFAHARRALGERVHCSSKSPGTQLIR
jgi:NADP-dependent 3-hydroxy acid dehydrogenase YdfG